MDARISIIIPVYNVEQYLPQCLDSVLAQTYTNLEIILVDDGSTDSSGRLCDEYAAKDSRIQVIHKSNGGLSDARNAGLNLVTGAYIAFVDSDDYITYDYIEILYGLLKETDTDMSIVDLNRFFGEKSLTWAPKSNLCKSVFTQKEAILDQLCRRNITVSACGKLYNSNIFRDIRFPHGEVYEDLAVAYPILLKTKRVAYTNCPLYQYLIRPGSTMQRPFDMRQYVEVRWVEEAMALVEQRYPELDVEIRGRRVWSYFKTLYRILCTKDRNKYREIQNEMIRKIRKDAKGLLRSNRIDRNLKIKIASLSFGRYGYFFVQKVSDWIKQIKAGHRYVV